MAKLTYNATMSDTDIVTGIASIGRRAGQLRKDIHSVATSILHNWAKSGDVSTAALRATELMGAIDAAHAQKCVNWFAQYASFTLVDTDDGKVFGYDGDVTTIDAETYQAARAESMFDLTPDKPVEPYVLREKIASLIEAATKRPNAKKTHSDDDIPEEMIAALRAIVA